MRCIVLFFTVLLYSSSQAQNANTITITPSDPDARELLRKEVYRYPVFAEGIVYFKQGGAAKSKMNYNRLFREMIFINPKGDTLALENEEAINVIVFGKDTFYYQNGYLEQIATANNLKLAVNQLISEAGRKKTTVYGVETSGPTALGYYDEGFLFKQLNNSEAIKLTRETKYFIANESNQFVAANKKNLLKIVPSEKKAAVETFVQTNNTNFDKREDLEKLFTFLKTL